MKVYDKQVSVKADTLFIFSSLRTIMSLKKPN